VDLKREDAPRQLEATWGPMVIGNIAGDETELRPTTALGVITL
jgi:hypothetical protein